MVLNDAQTEEVILGASGVMEGIQAGVVIIMSTASPSLVRKIAATLMRQKGIPVLDAPVSGVPGAAGGTMITMVGGDQQVLDQYRPVFDAMAKTVFYCGPSGSGAVAKLTNALIWEVSWNAVAEGLELGAREGLDPQLLLSIYNQSTAGCWATRNWQWVDEMRHEPGPLALEYKDMGMVFEFARERGVPAPLLELCYGRKDEVKKAT
jgi:3-hydroxyisobutyrate dehydrogenase-like beta-hydroxyacid dehydrogenase